MVDPRGPTLTLALSRQGDCVVIGEEVMVVILNGVKNLIISTESTRYNQEVWKK